MRVYLDSNVFISLFEGEIGKGVRGLFVEAEQFLERVTAGGYVLVLSELFFKEVGKRGHLSQQEVMEYLKAHNVVFEFVEETEKPPMEIFLKKGLHSSDALHAAVAVRHECDCIVTFNVKDFARAKDLISVFAPDDFI